PIQLFLLPKTFYPKLLQPFTNPSYTSSLTTLTCLSSFPLTHPTLSSSQIILSTI
ncbi:hypothetical protein KSS87_013820, partial [Heliosperma pusillum]